MSWPSTVRGKRLEARALRDSAARLTRQAWQLEQLAREQEQAEEAQLTKSSQPGEVTR